jgi:hypothetical protein
MLLAMLWLSKIDNYGRQGDCHIKRGKSARRRVRLHRSVIRRVGLLFGYDTAVISDALIFINANLA